MRILIGLAALAALGATAASAQPQQLSDAAYLKAARCVGLASSKALAAPDARSLAAWLDDEGSSRQPYILEKGDELRRQARREADRADDVERRQLQAELGGPCAALKG